MILYVIHTNLNIWKPIVCGNNQNLHTKGDPVVKRLFLPVFVQPH